jgi:hypothetical protein
MDAKELPNRIQIAYKRVWVGPFRTAGREEKGRVYLVGARRRRRSQRRRRGGWHRSPSRRRRETDRGRPRERETDVLAFSTICVRTQLFSVYIVCCFVLNIYLKYVKKFILIEINI